MVTAICFGVAGIFIAETSIKKTAKERENATGGVIISLFLGVMAAGYTGKLIGERNGLPTEYHELPRFSHITYIYEGTHKLECFSCSVTILRKKEDNYLSGLVCVKNFPQEYLDKLNTQDEFMITSEVGFQKLA